VSAAKKEPVDGSGDMSTGAAEANREEPGQENRVEVKRRVIPEPRWCPAGLTKTQRRWLQKLRKQEIIRKEEKAHDEWFNEAHPMVVAKKTCKEERLA
jgi:predicted nucleic acid-binding OB-fold protein